MADEFMTITDVAARLRVRERVVQHYLDTGELPYRKVGKAIRIRLKDMDAWWNTLQGNHPLKSVPAKIPDPHVATNGFHAVPEGTDETDSTFTRGARRQVPAPSIPRPG